MDEILGFIELGAVLFVFRDFEKIMFIDFLNIPFFD